MSFHMPYVRRLRANDISRADDIVQRGLVDAAIASSLLQAAAEGFARMTNLGCVVRIVIMNSSPPPRSPLIDM